MASIAVNNYISSDISELICGSIKAKTNKLDDVLNNILKHEHLRCSLKYYSAGEETNKTYRKYVHLAKIFYSGRLASYKLVFESINDCRCREYIINDIRNSINSNNLNDIRVDIESMRFNIKNMSVDPQGYFVDIVVYNIIILDFFESIFGKGIEYKDGIYYPSIPEFENINLLDYINNTINRYLNN